MFKIFFIQKHKSDSNKVSIVRKLKCIYLALMSHYHIRILKHQHDNFAILSDQSNFFRLSLWVVQGKIGKKVAVDMIRTLIPDNVFFVFIDTPPSETMRRQILRGRKEKIIPNSTFSEQEVWIEEYEAVVRILLERMNKKIGKQCVIVDGRKTAQENAENILKSFQKNYAKKYR